MQRSLALVSCLILAAPAAANIDPVAAQLALESGLAQTHASAAQAALIRNGQVLWQGTAGTLSLPSLANPTPTPATSSSLFALASVGKTYTSALTLKLVERGQLSLDLPLSTYLPTSTLPGLATVTPRMLLNHTAGYPDIYSNPDVVDRIVDSNFPWTRSTLLSYLQPPVAPGTTFEYSNSNYILLGEVLEQASGQSISTLFDQFIAAPLNLTNTYVDLQPRDRYAIGTLLADGEILSAFDTTTTVPTSLHGAAFMDGAIASNAIETGLFMDAIVRGELLSPDLTAQMLNFSPDSDYGLGIFTANYNGLPFIGHTGGWLGYSTLAFYQPDIDATLVVLTNGESLDGTPPAIVVLDAVFTTLIPEPTSLAPLLALSLTLSRRRPPR